MPRKKQPESSLPPNDRDCEQVLLGAMLLDDRHVGLLVDNGLDPEDFYHEDHRLIYQAALEVYRDTGSLDPMLLRIQLESRGHLETVGGGVYLTNLLDFAPTMRHALSYLGELKSKRWQRDLMNASRAITTSAASAPPGDTQRLVEESALKLLNMLNPRQSKFTRLGDLLQPTLAQIDAIREGRLSPGISTGIGDLDEILGGLHPGEFIVVSGAPKAGKSALVFGIVLDAALYQGVPCGVFSLEMDKSMLALRTLGRFTGLGYTALSRGRISAQEYVSLFDAIEKIENLPVYLDDSGGLTLDRILTKALYAKSAYKLGLIVVDYLQLIRKANPKTNDAEHISACSSELKNLASYLKIPVIAVSSVSKAGMEAEKSGAGMQAHHLRGSGQIPYDADVVILLSRPHADTEPEQAIEVHVDIRVEYQRNGPGGRVPTIFNRRSLVYMPVTSWQPEENRQPGGDSPKQDDIPF